jgi:hypothetical protein
MGLMDDIPLFYFNFDYLFEILKDAMKDEFRPGNPITPRSLYPCDRKASC